MLKTREITMMQMREKLGQYADEVFYTKTPILVTRKNRVIVEIVPSGTSKLLDEQRKKDFRTFEEIREANKNIPARKINKIINQAIKEVRDKRKINKN